MSEEISNSTEPTLKKEKNFRGITWGPITAIIVVVIVYFLSQYLGAQLTVIYPALQHWTHSHTVNWLNNSVGAQFIYVLIAESLTVAFLWIFINWRKGSFRAIGLDKPRLKDIGYALFGFLIYFPIYVAVISLLSTVIKSLNVTQSQQLGFSQSTTGWPLLLVFLSLVVFPPIVEEIMFRGFLYSGLKKSLPKIWAIVLTSLIFAGPHLLEGANGQPLWVAGVDTFVLSIVLIWLREKTGRLYASMGLHALKNFIAFASLFLYVH